MNIKNSLSLENFSVVVKSNASFFFFDGKIYSLLDINLQNIAGCQEHYPKSIDNINELMSQNEDSQAHLEQSDGTLLKRLMWTFFNHGFMDSIHMAADLYSNSNEPRIITMPAFYLRKAIDMLCNARQITAPQLWDVSENYVPDSTIRFISWHPLCQRLAVCTFEDSIGIFDKTNYDFVPILRGRNQKNISCISWRPYAAFDLAVGATIGVVLWKLAPNSIINRYPSLANATILRQRSVSSLSWNSRGSLLAAASIQSGYIIIWDCEQQKNEKIWCCTFGINLVSWAPNYYLFNSETDSNYKVWDTRDCSRASWKIYKGMIHTACWTPCGNHLIFATSHDHKVYTININVVLNPQRNGTPWLGPGCLLTTNRITLDSGESCGGLIQNLKISPNGSHLAIMFRCTNFIAVCGLKISSNEINGYPCFVFNGLQGERPSAMDFQHDYRKGSLLTVAWTSARLQHIPIVQDHTTE